MPPLMPPLSPSASPQPDELPVAGVGEGSVSRRKQPISTRRSQILLVLLTSTLMRLFNSKRGREEANAFVS